MQSLRLRSALVCAFVLTAPLGAATVTVTQIVHSGDSVPGRPAGIGFLRTDVGNAAVINDTGVVVFRATSAQNGNPNAQTANGLYVYRPDVPPSLDVLADSTEQSPGMPSFPVPGRPADARFTNFNFPRLNNAGEVLFHATFNGPSGAGSGHYVVNVNTGVIEKLADTFTTVPGHPTHTFCTFLFVSTTETAAINDAGQVVYWGGFVIPPASCATGRTGIFGTTAAGGAGVLLADSTETIGPSSVPLGGPGNFREIRGTPVINSGGTVAFVGNIGPSPSFRNGVFSMSVTGGPIATVAFRGQTAPNRALTFGDTFDVSGHTLDINDDGIIIFRNGLTGSEFGTYAATPSFGSYNHSRIIDTLGGIPVPGEADPPPVEFSGQSHVNLNESNQVAPYSFVVNSPTSNQQGVFSTDTDGTPIALVANLLTPPPGSPPPTAAFTSFLQESAAINDNGNLLFRATGTVGFRGLYYFDSCTEELVRISDSTIATIQLGEAFSTVGGQNPEYGVIQLTSHSGYGRSLNNNEKVAFIARFSNSSFGVYLAEIERDGGGSQLEITCPEDATIECSEDTSPGGTASVATAENICTQEILTATFSDSMTDGCGSSGVITRTWSADDGAGNSVSCQQTITVVDITDPALSGVPDDTSAECDAVPDPAEVTASDTCGSAAVSMEETVTAGPCPGTYTLTRTWTATDECENTFSDSQTITVADTTSPTLVGVPSDVSVECDAVPAAEVTASDNCDSPPPSVTFSETREDGDCPNRYTLTRTWTTEDSCGNPASATQIVTVVDTGDPTLSGVPDDVAADCDAVPPAATVTASDTCAGAVSVTPSETTIPGSCPNTYQLVRTWTATDTCNNAAIASQTLEVVDTTDPTVNCPADATGLECPADTSSVARGSATGNDNCGAATIGSSDVSTPGCGETETITRTWTATDGCGNAASCNQTIATVDTAPPSISVNTTPKTVVDLNCSGSEPVTLPTATANDECEGSVAVTNDGPSSFPAGQTTTVTYTTEDGCGNAATADVDVTVRYGAHIKVIAKQYIVGVGHHPSISENPIAGLEVGAYRNAAGTCARNKLNANFGSLKFALDDIVEDCTPDVSGVTPSNGLLMLDTPPGDYVIAAHWDSDEDGYGDEYLGDRVNSLTCGETELSFLVTITVQTNKQYQANWYRYVGSELVIFEPAEIVWDGTEQLYPFVFSSVGDWGVTVTVAPPEGFVADQNQLSENVNSELAAVQFTITEVGSDLVPTQTAFAIRHNGETKTLRSSIGIKLTPDYAKSRGFDVDELRRKGLIVEKVEAQIDKENPERGSEREERIRGGSRR